MKTSNSHLLLNAVKNAKDISVVGLWWLSVPAFITAMLMMKSVYMPGTTIISGINELATTQRYIYLLFFVVSPLVLIVVNILTIRKVYQLSGNPKSLNFLGSVWFNVLILLFSVLVLFIYSL
jgi:hypothetical protein